MESGEFKSPAAKGKLTWFNCPFVCYQREHDDPIQEALVKSDVQPNHAPENEQGKVSSYRQ